MYDELIDHVVARQAKKLRAQGYEVENAALEVEVLTDMWRKADEQGQSTIVRQLEEQMNRRSIPIPGVHTPHEKPQAAAQEARSGGRRKRRPRKKRKRKRP